VEFEHAAILVVDDEPALLDIFREWLEEESCRLLTAGDGAAALHTLRNHHVDVIVSDVRMPVMDGVLLLKNLTTYSALSQGNHDFHHGFADLEPREAYNLGVEAILQKPIERAEFLGTVRRTLLSHEENGASL
jgi:CheY-like chemotaxis protein